MTTRRALLAGAAGLLGGAGEIGATLRERGRRAGLLIGSSSEIDLTTAPDYAALIEGQCDLFAPNVSWQRMSPQPGEEFAAVDPNIAVAQRAGLRLTGYHLLWHQRLPGWFDGLDRSAAERAIVAHIRAIGEFLGSSTTTWNVVNEAVRPADHAPGGLRRSPLLEKFGTAFFDIAYAAAQEVSPGPLRVYNDYDLELNDASSRARRDSLLTLLDRLARRRVPIQAVGLQCHLRSTSFARFDPATFAGFLSEIAARGLDILITELDVQDDVSGSEPARDAAIAGIYRSFLAVALAQERLRVLAFWGLSDRYSWLNDPSRLNYRRADGARGRCLPFDARLQPKPALAEIERALDLRTQWKK